MLRLGVINVLNVLPVYYGILSERIKIPGELVFGRVTELNKKLGMGELDISVISSFEYARNPDEYYILPDLSVSSDGPVRSIYLFLKKPIEQLNGETILLTEFSLTSVHLIQYLLKNSAVKFSRDKSEPAIGELLIADDAISRFYLKCDPYVYDLGELWKKNTGLPFVFAVWAVRKESFHKYPGVVKEIFNGLISSKSMAGKLIEEMAETHYEGVFPVASECASYLKNLKYDLSEKFQQGFMKFQEEMCGIGKLEKVAPLNFINFTKC